MKNIFLAILLLASCIVKGQSVHPIIWDEDNQIIRHKGYTLSYNEGCEQANWVKYRITKADLEKDKVKRTDNFKEDKDVKTGSATLADYKGSGYDRGHLAAAADFAYNDTLMRESFYMSNMSPQDPSFNRGVWKRLEKAVRNMAIEQDTIYVITGGFLTSDLPTIGESSVCVPEFYYKVIYSAKNGFTCFLLRNEASKEPLYYFKIDKKDLETFLGIHFIVE